MTRWKVTYILTNKKTGATINGFDITVQPENNDMKHIPAILENDHRKLEITVESA